MASKASRFGKALWDETAKRVPVIIILLITLLLWQNYVNGQKSNAILNKIATVQQQNTKLAKDNKSLSQDNKNLSTQLNIKTDNINKHVDCIVTLFLPDKLPPTDADIDSCKDTPMDQGAQTSSGSNNTSTTSAGGSTQQSPSGSGSKSNSDTPPPTPPPSNFQKIKNAVGDTINNIGKRL